jgi:hypothetical protein
MVAALYGRQIIISKHKHRFSILNLNLVNNWAAGVLQKGQLPSIASKKYRAVPKF